MIQSESEYKEAVRRLKEQDILLSEHSGYDRFMQH